jgi:RHH-type rel operon transcriptional repressor/antitoxin RelB
MCYNQANQNMNKIASSKFTVSVKVATKRRLETLAKIAGRSSEFLAAEAISEYLDLNEAQVTGIKTAMGSLDRGAGIPQSSVREWVLSWGAQDERPIPRPSTV